MLIKRTNSRNSQTNMQDRATFVGYMPFISCQFSLGNHYISPFLYNNKFHTSFLTSVQILCTVKSLVIIVCTTIIYKQKHEACVRRTNEYSLNIQVVKIYISAIKNCFQKFLIVIVPYTFARGIKGFLLQSSIYTCIKHWRKETT